MIGFEFFNSIRADIERLISRRATIRVGRVTSYDASTYRVKVRLQPEDETGWESAWLPVATSWAGAGWGLFAPPEIGSTVAIHFVNGNWDAGYVSLGINNRSFPPLQGVQQQEFVLRHHTGSQLKFSANGNVTLQVEGDLGVTVTGGITSSESTGWTHTGNLTVSGEVKAGGPSGVALSTHTHTKPTQCNGSPNTGGPS